MNLYSPPTGNHPQELPDRWKFADGSVRTDLKSLTNTELLLLDWTGPITQPQPFTEELDEDGEVVLDEDGNPVIVGDYDAETHKTVWYRAVRTYVIVEKHIDEAPYDSGEMVSPPVGIADWNTFKTTALSSPRLNTLLGEVLTVAPVVGTAFPATFLELENGKYDDFTVVWNAINAVVEVPTELIVEFTTLAVSCNLPQEFIDIFSIT
jgi:hypothetical protein